MSGYFGMRTRAQTQPAKRPGFRVLLGGPLHGRFVKSAEPKIYARSSLRGWSVTVMDFDDGLGLPMYLYVWDPEDGFYVFGNEERFEVPEEAESS